MEIKIACQCGQRFAAPERLAGKTVKCPKCGSPLTIPEANQAAKPAPADRVVACSCGQRFAAKERLAGKTVKCPKCGSPLKIPQMQRPDRPKPQPQSAPRPEPELPELAANSMADLFDEVGLEGNFGSDMAVGQSGYGFSADLAVDLGPATLPSTLPSMPKSTAAKARGSLHWVGVGLGTMLLAIVMILVLGALAAASGFMPSLKPLLPLITIGVFLAPVLSILGQAICLTVPKSTGTKELIIAAVVMQVASIGASVFVRSGGGSASEMQIVALASVVLSFASFVTFLAFLKRLGEYLNRSDLAQKAQTLIAGGIGVLATSIVMIGGLVVVRQSGLAEIFLKLIALVTLGLGIFSLYLIASYVGLLAGLRSEIAKRHGQ